MNDVKEQLAALIQQEELHYGCEDYMFPSNETVGTDMLVSMLEEFADVVTDKTCYENPTAPATSPKTVSKSASVASFNDVQDLDRHLAACSSLIVDQDSFRFWRQQMFDWACLVVDSFAMDREIVAISFRNLDRYVVQEITKNEQPITRDDFQLFCMTSLYLSIKLLEPYPRKMGIEALVDMSRGFYSEQDIAVTEAEMLTSLRWHVNPPTANSVCRLLWDIFPANVTPRMQATAATISEIAVADASMISAQSSKVALAAVLHAARLEGVCDSKIDEFLASVRDVLPVQNTGFLSIFRQLEMLYGLQ